MLQAVEAVQQAKDHDPECAYTHFLAFKLALLLNQQEEGKRHDHHPLSLCFFPPLYSPSPLSPLSPPWTLVTSSLFPAVQSLQAMSACSAEEEEDSLGLISLAAQMAFEVSSSPQSRLEGVPFALSWLLLSFCVYSEATETWQCLLWRS